MSEGLFEYNGTTAHLFKSVVNGKPLTKGYNDKLDKISEEVDALKNFSYPFSDILLDDVQEIIDKYKEWKKYDKGRN